MLGVTHLPFDKLRVSGLPPTILNLDTKKSAETFLCRGFGGACLKRDARIFLPGFQGCTMNLKYPPRMGARGLKLSSETASGVSPKFLNIPPKVGGQRV
jgi:hypothetical protein